MAQNSGYVTVDGEFDTLEERSFFTIDDFEIKDKKILLRIDINSSINPENGEILDDTRIRRHATTVKELSEKNIQLIDDHGIDGDFIESQAFAYLAIRSFLGLPITFPNTTGCKEPCTGGVLVLSLIHI